MIDPKLRCNIDALLRFASEATPLPWDNEKWSNLTSADFSFVVFALDTAPEMARLLLEMDHIIEVEKMSREERHIGGLSDRLDKYIALQLAALEARLVAEFQTKIDALRTDAAALEAATARAAAAEGRVAELESENKAIKELMQERGNAYESHVKKLKQFLRDKGYDWVTVNQVIS
jgi:hypothetical protein